MSLHACRNCGKPAVLRMPSERQMKTRLQFTGTRTDDNGKKVDEFAPIVSTPEDYAGIDNMIAAMLPKVECISCTADSYGEAGQYSEGMRRALFRSHAAASMPQGCASAAMDQLADERLAANFEATLKHLKACYQEKRPTVCQVVTGEVCPIWRTQIPAALLCLRLAGDSGTMVHWASLPHLLDWERHLDFMGQFDIIAMQVEPEHAWDCERITLELATRGKIVIVSTHERAFPALIELRVDGAQINRWPAPRVIAPAPEVAKGEWKNY